MLSMLRFFSGACVLPSPPGIPSRRTDRLGADEDISFFLVPCGTIKQRSQYQKKAKHSYSSETLVSFSVADGTTRGVVVTDERE